jgi:hypothetical protein
MHTSSVRECLYSGTTTLGKSCVATIRLPASAALHQLRRASRCLGTSRGSSCGSSRGSSSTTSTTPRVWVPRHVARLIARRRLLRLHRASGCLGTSRGSSLVVGYFAYAARPGASARRATRHVSRCAALIDYFAYAARPGASARRAARHTARRRLLRAPRLRLAATLAVLHPRRAS